VIVAKWFEARFQVQVSALWRLNYPKTVSQSAEAQPINEKDIKIN
jgi:hypothetical protein